MARGGGLKIISGHGHKGYGKKHGGKRGRKRSRK
jgi:hypothetical protein